MDLGNSSKGKRQDEKSFWFVDSTEKKGLFLECGVLFK